MQKLRSVLANHRHFLIVVTVLTIVMTWPTVVYVFRTDVFWLPIDSGDTFIKVWEAWFVESILEDPANYSHTTMSFYPKGMSLAYHIFTVPHMILQRLLQLMLPVANAYNAASLLIIASGAAAAYVYILYLTGSRWASLFGSIVYGLSGYIVGRTPQPDHTFLAFFPLALYCFHRAVQERRTHFVYVCAALTACVAFTGMYMFVCLLMTLGAFIGCFALNRWRDRRFWQQVMLLIALVGAVGLLRISPMLADSRVFDAVLEKGGGIEQETDLLQYFINYANPMWNRLITNRVTTSIVQLPTPGRWNGSYLGYVPLTLIALGLFHRSYRRLMLPWLLLITPFLALRLGSVLTINGWQTGLLLPKHYLNEIFPSLFRAFYSPDHFQIGVLLPLAIMSSYGVLKLLEKTPARRTSLVMMVLVGLLAVEYYRSPERPRIVSRAEIAFLDWLKAEENQDIRLINLPMNRGNSKQYLLYQTLSGYPQAEGLATRTPPEAYDYIRSNLLLETWLNKTSIVCADANRGDYLNALDQLDEDGFTHVVLHNRLLRQEIVADSFDGIEPAYQDEYVAIYRLGSLHDGCP